MQQLLVLSTVVPEGRVFGLDSQTVIQIGVQLLNAIILAVVLTYILYKPVKEFLQKRTERIENSMNEADITMARAEELIAEYQSKIKEIDKERIEILEAARLEANEETKTILEEAKKEADIMKQRSIEKVSADKKRLQEESRLHIIELSSIIAEKYLSTNLDDEAQKKYFEDMVNQMEETQWPS